MGEEPKALAGADPQTYTLLCGIPVLPLLPMLLLNWPIRRNRMMRYSYQICLLVSVWAWSVSVICVFTSSPLQFLLAADMNLCNVRMT